jgi:hypothetical protein
MHTRIIVLLAALLLGQERGGRGGGGFTQPEPIAFDDHEGWQSIFDGSSLKDWDGNIHSRKTVWYDLYYLERWRAQEF